MFGNKTIFETRVYVVLGLGCLLEKSIKPALNDIVGMTERAVDEAKERRKDAKVGQN